VISVGLQHATTALVGASLFTYQSKPIDDHNRLFDSVSVCNHAAALLLHISIGVY
jgi:hypothetical protein